MCWNLKHSWDIDRVPDLISQWAGSSLSRTALLWSCVAAERWAWRPLKVPFSKSGMVDVLVGHFCDFNHLADPSLPPFCADVNCVLPLQRLRCTRANILSKELTECKQAALSLRLASNHLKSFQVGERTSTTNWHHGLCSRPDGSAFLLGTWAEALARRPLFCWNPAPI